MALLALPTAAWSQDPVEKGKEQPSADQLAKFSYLLGWRMAAELETFPMKLDPQSLMQAIQDRLAGRESKFSKEEMDKVRTEMMETFQKEKSRQMESIGEKNRAEGASFMAENGKKPGITTTASGLQYQVVREGKGEKPKASDHVTVHYAGTLLDGTEFDSSYKRGQPTTFPLDKVIAGWTEGLQLMQPGAKFKLFVPPQLAYGKTGSGGAIGPETTLIFEVELLEVHPVKATP
ncbi:MAG: FKBP-type peptidyl-prolyl cis-trans isomerase [Magnetococcales bacterium]|nr:FKBP-type peptidyl-prolyl cis-trans isomerase [Magnetococcales bacterium]MBF0148829.1 FKBP-type peptidyl-prolyl cis-trans isomerase [Magnetococcales bacterium]MBF0346443.1 FKBP-type peptidyl-prolyl cis-trans isomerase [Magnetococcales bacterium]